LDNRQATFVEKPPQKQLAAGPFRAIVVHVRAGFQARLTLRIPRIRQLQEPSHPRRMIMLSRFWIPAVLVSALLAAPAARAADTYDLDQAHFSIVFSVSHMNMSYTYGMFTQANAQVVLDKENPAASKFTMTIPAASINTNSTQRDTHLKGPDFFDVQSYPDITFESETVVLGNEPKRIVYQVTGNLTMHGVTKQVTLPIELLGEGPGPDQKQHAGFLMQTELQRSDFGMTKFIDNNMVGDAIGITVSFEGIKQ
jgi:polyisoprenoid-binding protein YceI